MPWNLDVSLLSRWLGCACSKLLQLHFCCSSLVLDDINDLDLGVPAFNVLVCSLPIVIAVVLLLESELI